jgi:hypothetical protein
VAALESVAIWPADLLPSPESGVGPRRSRRVRGSQRGSCGLAVLLAGLSSATRVEVLISDLSAPDAYQLQYLFSRLAGRCRTQQLALAMLPQGCDLTVSAAINRHAKPVLQQLQACPALLAGEAPCLCPPCFTAAGRLQQAGPPLATGRATQGHSATPGLAPTRLGRRARAGAFAGAGAPAGPESSASPAPQG